MKSSDYIDRCIAEQASAAQQLLAGHPEQHGLKMAINDWTAEECLLRREHDQSVDG